MEMSLLHHALGLSWEDSNAGVTSTPRSRNPEASSLTRPWLASRLGSASTVNWNIYIWLFQVVGFITEWHLGFKREDLNSELSKRVGEMLYDLFWPHLKSYEASLPPHSLGYLLMGMFWDYLAEDHVGWEIIVAANFGKYNLALSEKVKVISVQWDY